VIKNNSGSTGDFQTTATNVENQKFSLFHCHLTLLLRDE